MSIPERSELLLEAKQGYHFKLKPLPYAYNALAPTISEEALREHHKAHHGGYVKKLNKLLDDRYKKYRGWGIERIIRDDPACRVRNNAAQIWNHEFLWQSMSPDGGGAPKGDLAKCIKRCFGSYASFKQEFIKRGLMQFGSGWVWLIKDDKGRLEIVTTANEQTPFMNGSKCLLVADLWEHAYYLDFKSNRKGYLTAFLNKLVNWDFVAKNHED